MVLSERSNAPLAVNVRRLSPSSLRYEDQIEVRFPLTTLRVVLRNQPRTWMWGGLPP